MGIPKFVRIAATQRYFWLNTWYFMLEKVKVSILESEIRSKKLIEVKFCLSNLQNELNVFLSSRMRVRIIGGNNQKLHIYEFLNN